MIYSILCGGVLQQASHLDRPAWGNLLDAATIRKVQGLRVAASFVMSCRLCKGWSSHQGPGLCQMISFSPAQFSVAQHALLSLHQSHSWQALCSTSALIHSACESQQGASLKVLIHSACESQQGASLEDHRSNKGHTHSYLPRLASQQAAIKPSTHPRNCRISPTQPAGCQHLLYTAMQLNCRTRTPLSVSRPTAKPCRSAVSPAHQCLSAGLLGKPCRVIAAPAQPCQPAGCRPQPPPPR